MTKPVKKSVEEHAPWKSPKYELADVTAFQAIERGEANADQQKRALKWLIEAACGTYDLPYRPGGQDSERDTTFALGKQFVGQMVVKMLKLNVSILRRNEK